MSNQLFMVKQQKNSFNFLLQRSKNSDSFIKNQFIHLPETTTPLLIIGDILSVLKKIPSESISVVVTSPPYWNLRDYYNENQIGNENNPNDYIHKMVLIGNEILRILKKDGAYFLNIGDSYVNQNLQMIPQKIAIKMQENGWLIRNQLIWYKPNHMPSPVKSRFSNSYEMIYFFSKNDWERRVHFNLDAIRVPHKSNFKEQKPNRNNNSKFLNETKNLGASPAARLSTSNKKYTIKRKITASQEEISDYLDEKLKQKRYKISDLVAIMGKEQYKHKVGHWFRKDAGGSYPSKQDWIRLKKILELGDRYDKQMTMEYKEIQSVKQHPKGKNPGDLFNSNTAKSKYKHFAVFPESIPEIAIKSCCEENGIVLDPFAGSGTTGSVAKRLNRRSILIDIQENFIPIIKEKIGNIDIL